MTSNRLRLFLIGALLFPAAGICGDLLIIDADRQIEFADTLFAQTHYGEAVAEYRRFAHFFPEDPRLNRVHYQIGMALFHQKAFEDAAEQFLSLAGDIDTADPDAEKWRAQAYFRIKDCYMAMNAPGQALTALGNFLKTTDDPETQDRIHYEMGWIHLYGHAWQAAGHAFSGIRPEQQEKFRIPLLRAQIESLPDLSWKDPSTAGFLAILPGAGHLYLERYYDALTAFLLNTALIVGAYTAFDNDNPALGALAAFAGIGFYGGSIYGSISNAHKHNRRIADRFVNDLDERFGLHSDARPRRPDILLTLSFRF